MKKKMRLVAHEHFLFYTHTAQERKRILYISVALRSHPNLDGRKKGRRNKSKNTIHHIYPPTPKKKYNTQSRNLFYFFAPIHITTTIYRVTCPQGFIPTLYV